MAEWFNLVQSIHESQSTLIWRFLFGSLNLRSFEQQHQFNRKIKVKQVFLRNLLQFPWSRNIFARHLASRILWRSGFTGSNPILVLLLQKNKKTLLKKWSKRGSRWCQIPVANAVVSFVSFVLKEWAKIFSRLFSNLVQWFLQISLNHGLDLQREDGAPTLRRSQSHKWKFSNGA